MRGEAVTEIFMGFSGIYGDRCYAFHNSAARKGAPYLTATLQSRMLVFCPRFRHPERAAQPPNLAEAMAIPPGINPANAGPDDWDLDIITPSGEVVAVDDPLLTEMVLEGLRGENYLTLVHSNRALTDCRPVALISIQTVRQIGSELDVSLDKRRFRANIYLDLATEQGFAEDGLVGRKLRIGPSAMVTVLERDPRCKMISLNPETGEHDADVFRKVAQGHDNLAGVYCAVMVEGVLHAGDLVEVLD
jgi:hypothetical protein